MKPTPSHAQRGVAMMLVIVSLMMATILTTAYLASRDNSAAIGENITRSAASRWSAMSGMEMALAILQTQSTWRTDHVAGKLIDNLALAGGTVDVDVQDIETGGPPTATTRHVRLTVTSVVNGVEQVVTARATVQPDPNAPLDVDLSEFAIFAADRIDLESSATVTRWPAAPLTDLGSRLAVGTSATAAMSVVMSGSAAAIDADLYVGPGASPLLVSDSSSTNTDLVQTPLLDPIHVPGPPSAGVAAPSLPPPAPLAVAGGPLVIPADQRHATITISGGSEVLLQNDATLISDGAFHGSAASKLLVAGHSKIVVFGDLSLTTDAGIELLPGASLDLFVDGMLSLDGGYIGALRSNAIRDNSGGAGYTNLDRIHVYGTAGLPQSWTARNNSVVMGSIYAPTNDVQIENQSALYGCVVARRVRVIQDGAIFYDHALNGGNGYTYPDSSIYDAGGRVRAPMYTLDTLDPADLALLSSDMAIPVAADGTVYDGGTFVMKLAPPVPITEPTPRTIPVDHVITSFGTDMLAWENQ